MYSRHGKTIGDVSLFCPLLQMNALDRVLRSGDAQLFTCVLILFSPFFFFFYMYNSYCILQRKRVLHPGPTDYNIILNRNLNFKNKRLADIYKLPFMLCV
jgi:hypothetical protein